MYYHCVPAVVSLECHLYRCACCNIAVNAYTDINPIVYSPRMLSSGSLLMMIDQGLIYSSLDAEFAYKDLLKEWLELT